MKKLILILLIFNLNTAQAQKDAINWLGFEELEDSLKLENKPVLIYFYTDWCVYCKKMDRNAFKNSEIISAINQDFYAVKMNAESTENIKFDGQIFRNEQSKTKRNGIHQIPLILAKREQKSMSFPVVMILDKEFKIRKKSYEYLSSEMLKILIKG